MGRKKYSKELKVQIALDAIKGQQKKGETSARNPDKAAARRYARKLCSTAQS